MCEDYVYWHDLWSACDDVDYILYYEGSISRAELREIALYWCVYVCDICWELDLC